MNRPDQALEHEGRKTRSRQAEGHETEDGTSSKHCRAARDQAIMHHLSVFQFQFSDYIIVHSTPRLAIRAMICGGNDINDRKTTAAVSRASESSSI